MLILKWKCYHLNQNKTSIDNTELYNKIIDFVDLLLRDYYFLIIDITWVKYILLYYLDPSCHNFQFETPIISNELVDFLFNKILDKLFTSLDPGNPIGLEYGNSIQEGFTQQSLSSFHTQSKVGTEITKHGTTEFKTIVELSKKDKPDIVTCVSKYKEKLEIIKNRFEFTCLKDLALKINLIEEDNNNCTYKIIINKNYLSIKHITVEEYYLIINKFLSNIFIIVTGH